MSKNVWINITKPGKYEFTEDYTNGGWLGKSFKAGDKVTITDNERIIQDTNTYTLSDKEDSIFILGTTSLPLKAA